MNITNDFPPRPKRAQRRDGLSTRGVVLEAAGQVFAERGFAEATSKEICERAGTNSAAVNYYFGGKESLYEEVLVEAHRQMLSIEMLEEVIDSDAPPKEKLHTLLTRVVRSAIASNELWGIKVFLREIASPSPFVTKILPVAVLPKAHKIRSLVGEIIGFPPESVEAQRATAFVVMPCVSLIMLPETLRSALLPGPAADPDDLLKTLLAYADGGLRALKAEFGRNG